MAASACDWYAAMSEPPPELPSITTVSTPLLAQPPHAGADVDERVLEQEVASMPR